jgi:hypothetical protein
LKHRVHEAWEDVVDFSEQEWQEAVIAIAEDGEKRHEVVEVVPGPELEWIWVRWKKREDIGQGASDVEEFLDLEMLAVETGMGLRTYKSDAVDFHT